MQITTQKAAYAGLVFKIMIKKTGEYRLFPGR